MHFRCTRFNEVKETFTERALWVLLFALRVSGGGRGSIEQHISKIYLII